MKMLRCAVMAVAGLTAPAVGGPGPVTTVDELLAGLEQADAEIRTFRASIIYDRVFELQGDQHIRLGELLFRVDPVPGQERPRRTFAVHFDKLIVDGGMREVTTAMIFDGRWLVERDDARRTFIARELAPPGEDLDPLRLGEGPIPLPIGQKRAEILARYDASLLDPAEGLDDDSQYLQNVGDAYQLRLVPREAEGDDAFTEIRLWYDRQTLLPMLSRTVNRAGDVSFVQLTQVRTNEGGFPAERLDPRPPDPEAGWEVDIIRGDFDVPADATPPPPAASPVPPTPPASAD